MLPGLVSRKELVDLFRAEAKISAQLNHPNIVQVHDFGVSENVPFLVMEYLNGRNLTQLRAALGNQSGGQLAVGAAIAIARDVCLALGYAHDFVDPEGVRRQIIHRDVSPSNVMVCRDGSVKLLDFGVAKVAGQFDCDVTQSFRGKYAYMAPEQVNRQPIDKRVDVFAAGICLHEMLTGKRLFAAPSELETLERVAAAQVTAPSLDNPEVPRALDAIVKKALSRDPQQRYASGAEMAEALDELRAYAFPRKRLASYLGGLFPDAWTVTCEVCGKQVPPGDQCSECGTEAPQISGEAPAGMVPQPLVTSEPLPLPPVPELDSKRMAPNLRVVHTPVPDFDAPSTQETLAQLKPQPMHDSSAFEASIVDQTPVSKPPSQMQDAAATWLTPLRPEPLKPEPEADDDLKKTGKKVALTTKPYPAITPKAPPRLSAKQPSQPAKKVTPPQGAKVQAPRPKLDQPPTVPATPRLFVVATNPPAPVAPPAPRKRREDDSVQMGRPRPASPPPVEPPPPEPQLPSLPRPLHPSQTPAIFTPAPMHFTGSYQAPDLRKKSPTGKIFLGLLALGALCAVPVLLSQSAAPAPVTRPAPAATKAAAPAPAPTPVMVMATATPASSGNAPNPFVAAPTPKPAPAPVVATTPVTVVAQLPAVESPVSAQSRTSHTHHHRERAAAAPEAIVPKTSVRDGRIVDPFAGTD